MWWQAGQAEKRRSIFRFRLPSRKRAEAESPLRVAVPVSIPSDVGILSSFAGCVEPVGWLLRWPARNPELVTAINLVFRSAPRQHGAGPSREPSSVLPPLPTRINVTPTSTKDKGPSLAERLRILLAAPLHTLLPRPGAVLEWPGELMSFQLDGVRMLIGSVRILLADDMGLGKTLQVIAALRILYVQHAIESALVVVPSSLLDQWRQELSKWAPELRVIIIRGSPLDRAWQWEAQVHVTLVSYETLRSDFSGNSQSPVRRKVWDVVVADEAQRIKNRNDTSHAVKGLQRKRSWALSGTPIENNEDELASLLEFVDYDHLASDIHYQPGAELLRRHRELQLRRKKANVLDQLPPKQVTKIKMTLNPRQQKSYAKAEDEGIVHLRELGMEVRVQHVLELITRLKQICNADPETGESSKIEDIRERLTSLSKHGHRALVFSQYTSDSFGVGAVASALEDFQPLTLSGNMPREQRTTVIQRFKDDDRHKALVLSLRAGGVGLNLQEASYVFHLDRWWNPAVEHQAEDRSHRIGQTVKVNVIKYTCVGTIEERIDDILERKQDLFDKLVDDVSVDISTRMNSDELFGLFGLEAPSHERTSRTQRPSGLELEERCAAIMERRGYRVVRTSRSRDGGIDLIASRSDEVGIEQQLYIQCKDHARPVGVEVVRELIGVLPPDRNVIPVLASPAGVTADAQKTAYDRKVLIWDESKLSELEEMSNSGAE